MAQLRSLDRVLIVDLDGRADLTVFILNHQYLMPDGNIVKLKPTYVGARSSQR